MQGKEGLLSLLRSSSGAAAPWPRRLFDELLRELDSADPYADGQPLADASDGKKAWKRSCARSSS